MYIVVRNGDSRITDLIKNYTEVSNGIKVVDVKDSEYVIANINNEFGVVDIDETQIPSNFKPYYYILKNGKMVLDTEWIKNRKLTPEEELTELKKQLELQRVQFEMELADSNIQMFEMIMSLQMGGLE